MGQQMGQGWDSNSFLLSVPLQNPQRLPFGITSKALSCHENFRLCPWTLFQQYISCCIGRLLLGVMSQALPLRNRHSEPCLHHRHLSCPEPLFPLHTPCCSCRVSFETSSEALPLRIRHLPAPFTLNVLALHPCSRSHHLLCL